ncbi:MAG: SDR family NAD(P)-dependent oxidoreductase [Puniceicoccales bacterium]|jgi:short-subunit dehydrogenase|nr:SDR family NAD(P)-dependent oxidoreductase [Puniceicoccales bacterium]
MFPYREALVTGASRGLGRAFAEALQGEGVTVWGTSRNGARLPDGVRPIALDLGDPASIAACITRLGADAPEIDLLVNNAGSGAFHPFAQFPDASLAAQWQTLLAAPVTLCRAFFPHFVARRHGAIVNVTSLAGRFPVPCMSAYSAAKAAMSAFSTALMLEAAGTGVTIIDFQPGDFATGFNNTMEKCPSPDPATARVWARCEKHLIHGPPPDAAARSLLCVLRRRRSQTIVIGGFWQAILGPLLSRIAPQQLILRYLRTYYDL